MLQTVGRGGHKEKGDYATSKISSRLLLYKLEDLAHYSKSVYEN